MTNNEDIRMALIEIMNDYYLNHPQGLKNPAELFFMSRIRQLINGELFSDAGHSAKDLVVGLEVLDKMLLEYRSVPIWKVGEQIKKQYSIKRWVFNQVFRRYSKRELAYIERLMVADRFGADETIIKNENNTLGVSGWSNLADKFKQISKLLGQ